jgi:putative DNA primase/helicase
MGYVCRHDEFTHEHLIHTELGFKKLTDEFLLTLREQIMDGFDFEPRKSDLRDVIEARCWDNRFNSVVDYLDGLHWDGVPRIDTWLVDYCGAEDTELNRAIGRKVLCGAVRRAKRPGCEMKYTLVLEGEQDKAKSRMLKALVGGVRDPDRVFSDQSILDKREQEVQEHLEGRWFVELAELAGIGRRQIQKVKALLSRTTDRGRKAYGHYPQDQARSCIFVGTTNDQEYLADQTGNVRWWSVETAGDVDVEGIVRDRDQLFAEAVACEAEENLYLEVALVPDARKMQNARRAKYVWEEMIPEPRVFAVKVGDEYRVHSAYVLETCFDTDIKALAKSNPAEADRTSKLLARVMTAKGWKKKDSLRVHGRVASGYVFKVPELPAPRPPTTPRINLPVALPVAKPKLDRRF